MTRRVPSWVPEGLLYGVTAFGPFAFGCVEPWSLAALEILVFLLALACFLRGRLDVPATASWFWLLPAAFAVLGALQSAMPAAPDLPRPWGPFTAAPHATQAAVVLWTAYAALSWSVPRVIATHEAARRYSRLLFGLGAVLAAQGMLQTATGGNNLYWLRPTGLIDTFGPYYNRDHAASFLLMAAAMGIGILFSKMRPSRAAGDPGGDAGSQARFAAAGVLVVFGGLAVCASRGAFLGMLLAVALVGLVGAAFAKRSRSRRLRAAAALAFAAFVGLFAFRIVGAGADAGAPMERPIAERLMIYADAGNWLRDAPVFGTGLGSFETVYPAYQDLDLTALVQHAHSDWLELALETGLVGLFAALAAAALVGFGAARTWLAAGSGEMRALIGGALAGAAAFAFHSLSEFGFQIPGNAVVFLGLVGFLLSAPRWASKAAPRVRPEAPPAWAAVAAIGCCLALVHSAARPAAEEDPQRIRGLAAVIYARADAGQKPDAASLRAALALSLAAVELRPFDYRALELAGATLARLRREADARVFFERSRLVRFTPIVVGAGDDGAGDEERRLATLKSLGLLPQGGEKR